MTLPIEKPNYRPDIDGLRALAVIGVLLFHIDAAYLPGGFLGVDVFFVISGYLITAIIRKDIEGEGFSYARFYERRIKRLMPALFVLIAVVSVTSAVLMWPANFEAYGKSIKYVVISMANFHFFDCTGDYFGGNARGIPLLHTWSLAVEEQFYLLFPPLLIGLNRFFGKRRGFALSLWVLLAVSLAACVIVGRWNPMEAFFLLPFRAWELLTGAVLTLTVKQKPAPLLSAAMSWSGLLMVLGSFFFVREENLWAGLSSVPACLGAALVIHSGRCGHGFVRKILSVRWLVLIGLISYSLYLWHWPLVVFRDFFLPPGGLQDLILIIASLALGFFSWRYIELPFRGKWNFRRPHLFAAWAAITLVMVLASQWIRKKHGFPGRFPVPVAEMLAFGTIDPAYAVGSRRTYDLGKAPVFGDRKATPDIALWGDSHAEALLPVLDVMAAEHNKAFRAYIIPGQAPVPGFVLRSKDEKENAHFTSDVFAYLRTDTTIRTVILHARWCLPIRGMKEAGQNTPQELYDRNYSGSDQLDREYSDAIHGVVTGLLTAGKRVVIIYPIPEIGENVPLLFAQFLRYGKTIPEFMDCADFESRNGDIVSWFDSYPEQPGLTKIRPHELLYGEGKVRISVNGLPLYRDDDHLGKPGGEFIRDILTPIFTPAH